MYDNVQIMDPDVTSLFLNRTLVDIKLSLSQNIFIRKVAITKVTIIYMGRKSTLQKM